ncbi:hypothetical protein ACOBV9_17800 [Pseudoalteromonas espejiana]
MLLIGVHTIGTFFEEKEMFFDRAIKCPQSIMEQYLKMELNVLLVSLLPMDEELFIEQGQDRDITLFEKALDEAKERNDDYSIKVYINDPINGYLAGIISKNQVLNFMIVILKFIMRKISRR